MEKEQIIWRKATAEELANGSPEMVEVSRTVIHEQMPASWDGLRSGLITSKAFIRAIQNPAIVNEVAYGALQSILSTEGSEDHLKSMLIHTMEYTSEEKAEINKILSDNYFSIQL